MVSRRGNRGDNGSGRRRRRRRQRRFRRRTICWTVCRRIRLGTYLYGRRRRRRRRRRRIYPFSISSIADKRQKDDRQKYSHWRRRNDSAPFKTEPGFKAEIETGPPPGLDLDLDLDRQMLGVSEPDAAPARLYRIGGEPPVGVRHPDFLPVKLDPGARHVELDLQTPSKLPLEFDCDDEFFLRFEPK